MALVDTRGRRGAVRPVEAVGPVLGTIAGGASRAAFFRSGDFTLPKRRSCHMCFTAFNADASARAGASPSRPSWRVDGPFTDRERPSWRSWLALLQSKLIAA